MSQNLMDTEIGGEQTQYESAHTFVEPHSKSGGQMSDPETKTSTSQKTPSEKKERGEQTAENIRYGQAISEHGMGGQTTTSSGSAGNEGGFGDETSDQTEEQGEHGESRGASGYGGDGDMSREVGA